MNSTETLPLPKAGCVPQYLEDTSTRQLILELYDQEHVAIRRYLVFLGVSADLAQEIVQDAFVKLHEHLLANGDRGNLRAWLYKVARNMARNAQSAARVTRTHALDDSVRFDVRANSLSAEEELLENERTVRLRQAIKALSTAQRECLALRAQGLKYREIAEALNLSVSAVGENVQRGLEKLKEFL